MLKILLGLFLVLSFSCEVIANELCSDKKTPREATRCLEEIIKNLQVAIAESERIQKVEEDIRALSTKVSNTTNIPKDAVLAFANATCPTGWEVYKAANGRVIVGSGLAKNLSPRVFEQTGGAETHLLTLNELPKHAHSHVDDSVAYKPASRYEGLRTEFKGDSSVGLTHGARTTGQVGGNKAHNNMPPFVVLAFCKQK